MTQGASSMNRTRFLIELEPLADWNTPAVVRLRRLLKSALRTHGLRCITAVETQPTNDPRSTQPSDEGTA